jgi:hypothetical protein
MAIFPAVCQVDDRVGAGVDILRQLLADDGQASFDFAFIGRIEIGSPMAGLPTSCPELPRRFALDCFCPVGGA